MAKNNLKLVFFRFGTSKASIDRHGFVQCDGMGFWVDQIVEGSGKKAALKAMSWFDRQ